MDDEIDIGVATIMIGHLPEEQSCAIVVATRDGKTVRLWLSGEGLREFGARIEQFFQAHPEAAKWRSAPRQ